MCSECNETIYGSVKVFSDCVLKRFLFIAGFFSGIFV